MKVQPQAGSAKSAEARFLERMIHVQCPNCGKDLDLAEAVGGTTRKCPVCDAEFAVPEPEPPVLEELAGGEEESSDFEVMEEQEEDRIGGRPRRRLRRPGRKRVEKVYVVRRDDSTDVLSGMFTGQKVVGLVLMIWGVLNVAGSVVLGMKAAPVMCGGAACGMIMAAVGIYLWLTD
jgi:hypothetical protein